jgi:catechol 2,3-dioxygenase-like lactoylglutathione lyase family enzyme
MNDFRVIQLDHVELFVPNRHEAAEWYQRVLGLEIVPEYELWAQDPQGPLMISSDCGSTKLALFRGSTDGAGRGSGYRLVAFRVDGSGFIVFLSRLESLQLRDHLGRTVTMDSVVDHDKAYSVYFSDPYGHRLEVTSYDHDALRKALTELRAGPLASLSGGEVLARVRCREGG